MPFKSSAELDTLAKTMLSQLPADVYPWFTEMIVEHAMKPGYAYAHEFEFGLELILDGIENAQNQ